MQSTKVRTIKRYPQSQVVHPDGRVDLGSHQRIKSSSLFNEDLAPKTVAERNWTIKDYCALWMGMSACIPSYMLAAGLLASGMNCWQAMLTVLLGNIIVLADSAEQPCRHEVRHPIPGSRASYGPAGSNLPALMRAIVACGWFGIQAWIGGQALYVVLCSLFPSWRNLLGAPIGGYPPTQWISFALFWSLNILVVFTGMNIVRKFVNLAAPFVMVMTLALGRLGGDEGSRARLSARRCLVNSAPSRISCRSFCPR